MKYFFTYRC